MVRVHQAAIGRDDSVPVGVAVVAGCDVVRGRSSGGGSHEFAQRSHGVRGGAVHPDFAVPVQRHEGELGVGLRVHHGQIEAVTLADDAPVLHARTTERVGADANARVADRVEVDNRGQVVNESGQVVVLDHEFALHGAVIRNARNRGEACADDFVGAACDPAGDIATGRAAVGGVVLNPAIGGGIVRRRHYDAVGDARSGGAYALGVGGAVVEQDRVRDGGRRRVGIAGVDADLDAGRYQHLDGGLLGRLGEHVAVASDVERAVDALGAAVFDHGERDRGHVGFGERAVQAGTPVAGGAEHHLLHGVVRIGNQVVVRADHGIDVDEVLRQGDLAGAGVHGSILPGPARSLH